MTSHGSEFTNIAMMRRDDPLKGQESQRLRTYFTSNCMEPSRDLDTYGRILFNGNIHSVKGDFRRRVSKHAESGANEGLSTDSEGARKAAAQEVYELKWGPTRVPIFDLLFLAALINPSHRSDILAVTRWLIDEAKVPVDGKDLSGTNTLYHTISTKPALDFEFAQILYDAGADINMRNRYGGTAASEITMVWEAHIPAKARRAASALEWFLSHGGNINIKDNDGVSPRHSIERALASRRTGFVEGMREVYAVVEKDDRRRRRLGGKCCTFCGREPTGDIKLLSCSRCRAAKYCSPSRECQKGDWPHHKVSCQPPPK